MLSLLMIPLVATFASPVSSGQHAVAYGIIAAVATGYGIVLACALRNVGLGQVRDWSTTPQRLEHPKRMHVAKKRIRVLN
jgi:hypothetical protein